MNLSRYNLIACISITLYIVTVPEQPRLKSENAHQYNISHDGPRQIECDHPEEHEDVCYCLVYIDTDEGQVHERGWGKEGESADERVAVFEARAQALR